MVAKTTVCLKNSCASSLETAITDLSFFLLMHTQVLFLPRNWTSFLPPARPSSFLRLFYSFHSDQIFRRIFLVACTVSFPPPSSAAARVSNLAERSRLKRGGGGYHSAAAAATATPLTRLPSQGQGRPLSAAAAAKSRVGGSKSTNLKELVVHTRRTKALEDILGSNLATLQRPISLFVWWESYHFDGRTRRTNSHSI